MNRPKMPRPKGYENYEFPFTVKKPWGKEVWLELWQGPKGHGYCYKRIYIKSGTKTSFHYHRIIDKTDVFLQEVSTPDVDDVIRLQDDSGRGHGRIESEHKR